MALTPASRPAHAAPSTAALLGACVLLLALAPGCPAPPTSPDAELCGGSGCPPPPPKPGASLTSSELCTCRACEPHSCCVEKTDDGSGGGCQADGYNFSADQNCGLAVASCKSRCFEHRWRAELSKGCAATKPERCCD